MDGRPYNYEFSPLAEQDLNEIFDYIAWELSALQAAVKLIDKIQEEVEKVCDFPFSRPLLRDRVLREKGYRLIVVQNFNLFYVVERQTVVIKRVMHGKRNYENLL